MSDISLHTIGYRVQCDGQDQAEGVGGEEGGDGEQGGGGDAEVQWYLGGVEQHPSSPQSQYNISHHSEYKCVATNKMGSASRVVTMSRRLGTPVVSVSPDQQNTVLLPCGRSRAGHSTCTDESHREEEEEEVRGYKPKLKHESFS